MEESGRKGRKGDGVINSCIMSILITEIHVPVSFLQSWPGWWNERDCQRL